MILHTGNTIIRKSPVTVLLVLTGLLLLTGCHDHKELVHSGPVDVTVHFDWSAVPGAQPSEMALAIFVTGAQPVQTAFNGYMGGDVELIGPQRYAFVAFNGDTESLFTRGSDWGSYEIYSQPTTLSAMAPMFRRSSQAPRAYGTEDEDVVFQPDLLWTAATSSVEMMPGSQYSLDLPMEAATCDYHFTINNVENLSYATSLVGTLSGMSGSWMPSQRQCSDSHCIIPFELSGDGTTIEGTVRTFGHCPGHDAAAHKLVIYAEMKDGSKVYFQTDVTGAMHDADHVSTDEGTGHTDVPIVIESLPLPKPITNGSGLQPAVEEWTEVMISVPMG